MKGRRCVLCLEVQGVQHLGHRLVTGNLSAIGEKKNVKLYGIIMIQKKFLVTDIYQRQKTSNANRVNALHGKVAKEIFTENHTVYINFAY